MNLKAGIRAIFKCFNAKEISGKITQVLTNHYLVVGDDVICGQYDDTLFRFTDKDVVRLVNKR